MTLSNSKIYLFLGTCSFVLLGTFGYLHYEAKARDDKEFLTRALDTAVSLLQRAHPLRAKELLDEHKNLANHYPDFEREWNALYLESAVLLEDSSALYQLWLKFPEMFNSKQHLNIQIAKQALSEMDLNSYKRLSQEKNELLQDKESWTLLEADAFAMQGAPDKAIALLNQVTFDKPYEIPRLLRLALLNEKEHPKIAWEYLLKALKIDPNNPTLHLYRAQVLDGAQLPELAKLEFHEALSKNSQDPLYKEEFADFLLRKAQFSEASHFLQTALTPPTSDKLWLKALFLSKVYQPSKTELIGDSLPAGTITPFVRYLLAISPREFWNDALLTSQAKVENISENIPEGWWLKVFEELKLGQDTAAFQILQDHPEIATLNPPLYAGLMKAIVFHNPLLQNVQEFKFPESASIHPAFRVLSASHHLNDLSSEYAALFSSKDSYAALILASGWFEAALNLHQFHPHHLKQELYSGFPSEFPRWVAFGFAKALLHNRSSDEALSFIQMQIPTPQLTLLAGEINLKLKNFQDAEKQLTPLAKATSPLGIKAALLLSNLYAEQGNFLKAREAILNQKNLSQSTAGKETLARLENTFGDPLLAEKMYASISDASLEAKSFLAKKAFDAKDYKRAHQLTKSLVQQFPERADLKAQLNQIAGADSLSSK